MVRNGGDAVAYCNLAQTGAANERSLPDPGDAVRNHDFGQETAVRECLITNGDDPVGDRIVPRFSTWVLDESGLGFVE